MQVLIKYNSINIRMTNLGSTLHNVSYDTKTREELSERLYQILDLRIPNGNVIFYLYNLYIDGPKNSKNLCKSSHNMKDNDIIQRQFNEVIQLFIDVKEQDRIRADNVNNIILNVKFNDSKERSSTKLIGKLIQVYNKTKSIKISVDTVVALSEIKESLVDKDLSLSLQNHQIILNAKKEMKQNIALSINSENVDYISEASQRNDELTEEYRKITNYRTVEDKSTEGFIDNMCLITSHWHNDDNCGMI